MDHRTIQTYDAQAADYAARQRGKTPAALYRLIERVFVPGAPTADIGCGSGRDSAWLVAHGFPTIGYDASPGMLAEARAAYPNLDLRYAALPDLAEIPAGAFTNVLCSAVVMHLPAQAIEGALAALCRIVAPGGRLLITYRASETGDPREPDGRLYTPLAADTLATACARYGLQVWQQTAEADGGRPGMVWHVLVAGRAAG
ncbi:MAG: class I SAM-dependent methyltransferase [Chloroflexaceae bacterium]